MRLRVPNAYRWLRVWLRVCLCRAVAQWQWNQKQVYLWTSALVVMWNTNKQLVYKHCAERGKERGREGGKKYRRDRTHPKTIPQKRAVSLWNIVLLEQYIFLLVMQSGQNLNSKKTKQEIKWYAVCSHDLEGFLNSQRQNLNESKRGMDICGERREDAEAWYTVRSNADKGGTS